MPESVSAFAINASCKEVVTGFGVYLVGTRGVRPGTQRVYSRHVREFLERRFPLGIVLGRELSARDLFLYVTEHAARGRVVTTKLAATALRSFIRYLVIRGDCDPSLIDAVPCIPNWRLSRLPRVLSEQQAATVMANLNRATPIGRRDYAIILCLVRLGLRAGDVVRLSLDDVDWRSGILRIQGEKSRRARILPLLQEVGSALVAYVLKGRPTTNERRIFVSHRRGPQKGMPMTGSAIWAVVRRAVRRSGIDVGRVGAHTLRHTFASQMLHNGVDLKRIADILGHCSLDTTFVYTKVDLDRLAEVAQPWPGVTS
ncbi:MAG: site-specific integrase [Bacillota bacterium]|nr:site-specific integrase [Bacillota bacterium]